MRPLSVRVVILSFSLQKHSDELLDKPPWPLTSAMTTNTHNSYSHTQPSPSGTYPHTQPSPSSTYPHTQPSPSGLYLHDVNDGTPTSQRIAVLGVKQGL